MFQNINADGGVSNSNYVRENKINLMLKEIFKLHNCVIYILAFLVSAASIKNEILPFGLAIVAACMGSTVPIFVVYIISFISTAVFHGLDGLSAYFYTSIIFFLTVFMFKPKVSLEDRNEVFKVGTRIFIASFLYNLINNLRDIFLIYDLFLGTIIAALTYTFYKIFVNGIVVIRDFKDKKAFTIEEIISAALICSIAISAFSNVKFFSLSITNILVIFIILLFGLKNGMLVGGTVGLSIGLALTLIGNITLLQLTVFAVSGILAGVLNKFGKIGVIVGFILGNAILTYLANGNTATIIYFREIFISAVLLIFVPSKVKIQIEDLMGKEKLLTNRGEHRLNYYQEIKDKLSAVANTISEMNNNFYINNATSDLSKEIYIDNFLENMEDYGTNIFYEDVVNNQNIIEDIFDEFKINDIITENIIVNIFKKYNNYILMRDQKIKEDLQELIKIANRTYREMQIKKVKAETKKEENKKMSSELKNVTNMINKVSSETGINDNKFETKEKEIQVLLTGKGYNVNNVSVVQALNGKYIVNLDLEYNDETIRDKSKIANISDIISKSFGEKFSFQKDKKNLSTGVYIQTYSAEDKYIMQVGSSKTTKENSTVSGDSNLQVRLEDGKYLLVISDGMGSGKEAKQSSKFVVNTLNNLLAKGFEEDDVVNLINSELNLNKEDEMYASVDMSVFDLYSGTLSLMKNGACNTYIKTNKKVNIYPSDGMPIGIVNDINLSRNTIELNEGDIVLMCSDGLLEVQDEIKKDWIADFLKNVNTNNVQKIADLIVSEAIDNSYGIAKDDITVIVAKIIRYK